MQASLQGPWWDHRQWRFVADMNKDGIVSLSDLPHWGHWLFYLPGDAFIATFGTTRVGTFLELSPASLGGGTAAALSVALWTLALLILAYVPLLFVDIVDPTSRQERRERRQAQREKRRHARLVRKARIAPRRAPRREERREPYL